MVRKTGGKGMSMWYASEEEMTVRDHYIFNIGFIIGGLFSALVSMLVVIMVV